MKTLTIACILLSVGCVVPLDKQTGTKCGETYTATGDMILLDLPYAPTTDMDIDERTTGIIRTGDRYEVRDLYREVYGRYRYGKLWCLLVSHDDTRQRGWACETWVRGK